MRFFYSILFLLGVVALQAQSNTIVITGRTNINTFRCTNTGFKTYIVQKNIHHIEVNVGDFDCNNRIMTNDFRKTLKANEFPKMQIKFIKFQKITTDSYAATIEVKLMDRSKIYDVDFRYKNQQLMGSKRILFSDFSIIPPKRMGGTIVVKNELDLSFNFVHYL